MNLIVKPKPFPHFIIEDFYTDQEYDLVWKELQFLQPKMLPPEHTNAANADGIYQKKGTGLFLYSVYTNVYFSDIGKISKKIFNDDFKQKIDEESRSDEMFCFRLYRLMKPPGTLAQLYMNGDYYKSHTDFSVFTNITVVNSTPKHYTGGELHFPEFDYTVNLENNMSIIFPSVLYHEVLEVKSLSKNPLEGRFSISQLMITHSPEEMQEMRMKGSN